MIYVNILRGGDAHFDSGEAWVLGAGAGSEESGTSLLQTAAHEFGHSLGLSHSDQPAALMAPFYRGDQGHVALDQDDITAVQALYGEKEEAADTGVDEREGGVGGGSELCRDGRIDSIVSSGPASTLVTRGSLYWLLNGDSVKPGYPQVNTYIQ